MSGFINLKKINPKNLLDSERERHSKRQTTTWEDIQYRAEQKAQEIINNPEGEFKHHATTPEFSPSYTCNAISRHRVGEIMSPRVVVLSFDDNLLTVHDILSQVKFHHLPVISPEGEIIGIISDRDYFRLISPFWGTVNEQTRDKEIMTRRVGTVMTRDPICAHTSTTILQAVKIMHAKKISCLPIVNPNSKKLVGIVTWKDMVNAYCPITLTSYK